MVEAYVMLAFDIVTYDPYPQYLSKNVSDAIDLCKGLSPEPRTLPLLLRLLKAPLWAAKWGEPQ